MDYIPKYTICMLSVLLHDVCTFLHNYKLRDVCTICTIASYETGTMMLLIAQDFAQRHVSL